MTWKRATFLEEVQKDLSKAREEREKDDEAVNKLLAAYVEEGCKRRKVLQEFNEHFPDRVPVVEVDLISVALNEEEVEETLSKVRKHVSDNLDKNTLAKAVFGDILMNKLPKGVKDSYFKRIKDMASKHTQADQEESPQPTFAKKPRSGKTGARLASQSPVSLWKLKSELPPPRNRRVTAPRTNDDILVVEELDLEEVFPCTIKRALEAETAASEARPHPSPRRQALLPGDLNTSTCLLSENRDPNRHIRLRLRPPVRTSERVDVPLKVPTKDPGG